MIGYHYTTYSNWLKIQKEGLRPMPNSSPAISEAFFGEAPDAVWLFRREAKGLNNVGNVLQKVVTTSELRVVKLQCKFRKDDLVTGLMGQQLEITHWGTFGDWTYHDNEEAFLVKKPILPSKIKVVADYDLEKLLK